MDQQVDSGQLNILDEQYIGTKLFPPRIQNKHLQLTPIKLQKFMDLLKCPLCLSIMENPIYLQCSHRFCKECLEKYIRKNEKKSCPNCLGRLATKRDLRIDLSLITMIKINIGQKKDPKLNLEIIDKKETQSVPLDSSKFDNNKIKQYKQLKSEPRKRIKQDVGTRKVTRSRLKQHIQQNSNIQTVGNVKNIQEDMLIDVQISKSDENWQRPNATKKSRGKGQKQKLTKKQSSKEQIPSSLKQIPSKNSAKQQQVGTSYNMESVCSSINQQQAISISDQQGAKFSDKQLQEAQTFLQAELGPQYLKKLLQIASDITCIDISLLKFNNLIRTPQLPSSVFKMSLNTKLIDIKKYISSTLNIKENNWVKLLVCNKKNQYQNLDIKQENLTLYQINELYWKNYQQISAFDMRDIVNWLNQEKQRKISSSNKLQQRVIYYAVEYTS